MPVEISVKVSGDEQVLVEKFLVYDQDITISHECEALKSMVEGTIAKFKGQPSDVVVRVKYTW